MTKVIFMGTPDFSVTALRSLVESGYDVVAVYSQPPRPAGRGHSVVASPVHQYADSVGIPVHTPKSLRSEDAQVTFRAHEADIAVVAAYGLILPKAILDAPRLGCINIHASILPRWRGAAPIQRAILAGDPSTGVTIMQMDEGLDTGDMILWDTVAITPETTANVLHDQLSKLGANLLMQALPEILEGCHVATKQPETGVTYAHKLSKSESQLDWIKPAEELERQIRAFHPWPGTFFVHNDVILKVSRAEIAPQSGQPGQVFDGLTIACGDKSLKITSIQKPGGKWMSADDFLRGYNLSSGTLLPCPATN